MAEPTPLPPAFKEGNRNFWTKGAIRRYCAQIAGLPEPQSQADDDHLVTSRGVREMLGGVSHMWLYRRRPNNTRGSSPEAA